MIRKPITNSRKLASTFPVKTPEVYSSLPGRLRKLTTRRSCKRSKRSFLSSEHHRRLNEPQLEHVKRQERVGFTEVAHQFLWRTWIRFLCWFYKCIVFIYLILKSTSLFQTVWSNCGWKWFDGTVGSKGLTNRFINCGWKIEMENPKHFKYKIGKMENRQNGNMENRELMNEKSKNYIFRI